MSLNNIYYDSYQAKAFNDTYITKSTDKRPYAMIKIGVPDKLSGRINYRGVKLLVDSGNDVTLLSMASASTIGINPKQVGRQIKVQGINGPITTFYMVTLPMQFGDTKPIIAKMAFGDVRENLMGREDIFSKFIIGFLPGKIYFKRLEDPVDYSHHFYNGSIAGGLAGYDLVRRNSLDRNPSL